MSRHTSLVSLLAGVAILASASGVQAAEPTAEAQAVAPAPADGFADKTSEADAAKAPVGQPSQSPEDVSGGNEYTEDGIPTGTGEDSQPVEPNPEPAPSPAQGTNESPTGGSVTVEGAAEDTAGSATAAATLPRTGGETSLLALTGLGLLALGGALGRIVRAPARG